MRPCRLRQAPDAIRDAIAAVMGEDDSLEPVPSRWGCRRRIRWGLLRRDIAFLRRLAGRSFFLLTDQSPYRKYQGFT